MSSVTDKSSENDKNHQKVINFYISLFFKLLKCKINYYLYTYLHAHTLSYLLIPVFSVYYFSVVLKHRNNTQKCISFLWELRASLSLKSIRVKILDLTHHPATEQKN